MKKTKILMIISTVSLASTAFLGFKLVRPKKCITITIKLPILGACGAGATVQVTASLFTTVQGTHKTALVATSGGSKIATFLTATNGLQKVYFK